MISKGFYFSSKIEKNKGDRDFNIVALKKRLQKLANITEIRPRWSPYFLNFSCFWSRFLHRTTVMW